MDYGYLNKNKCVLLIQKHRCGESLLRQPLPKLFPTPVALRTRLPLRGLDYSSVVKLKGIAG